ncbi:sensor histidine kinase [Stappia sediminis]|nr:ATP-binding protein [Stappia sediminis]
MVNFVANRGLAVRIFLLAQLFLYPLSPALPQGDERSQVARVLIVSENESTLNAIAEIRTALQREFEGGAPTSVELYTEYLDTVRFPGSDLRDRLVEMMTSKYADAPLDVVITIGPGAFRFILENREAIAPDVAIVAGAITEASIDPASLQENVWGIISHFDVPKTLDLALRLQPDASRIVVLSGSSDFDRSWRESARRDLAQSYHGVEVKYLSGLTLDGFKEAAAALPPTAILLVLTVFEDADGRAFIPKDATTQIASASAAPAYGVYSSYIGTGIVGGFIETFDGIGVDLALMAKRIISGSLSGERLRTSPGRPTVDWRQLARWEIHEALLPTDTLVLHHDASIWDRYRLQILAILAILMLQSGTIAALIVLDRRKRRIEKELALERLELAHLSRTTQLGELSGSFAHELNQPLTSILANAEAGIRLIDREEPDIPEIRNILEDIASSDRRAAGVIKQLRQMMLKGEVTLEPMDLNEAVSATLALLRGELVERQTKVSFIRNSEVLPVKGNMAQLQQIVLNLTMNAADAMADLPASNRRIQIETYAREDGTRTLSVSDRGSGVSPELREAAFQPFVSGKTNGMGLGLAICRSIAGAHGGTLEFDEKAGEGTRIILTLPAIGG